MKKGKMTQKCRKLMRGLAATLSFTILAGCIFACKPAKDAVEETDVQSTEETVDLNSLERFNAFEGIELVYGREGRLELNCIKAPMDYFEYSVEQKEDLKNGDKVKVTIEKDREQFFARIYGKLPEAYECELEVEGLVETGMDESTQESASPVETALTAESGQQAEIDDSEYVFPYSDKEYLTDKDINDLTEKTAKIARNELYARHGYIFKSGSEMEDYFSKLSWYTDITNKTSDMKKVEKGFNSYESANVTKIKQREKKMHWNNQK